MQIHVFFYECNLKEEKLVNVISCGLIFLNIVHFAPYFCTLKFSVSVCNIITLVEVP